jgi:hypothetical protein
MEPMSGTSPLPRWVRAADGLTVALALVALAIWMTGGFVMRPFGVRLSFRSEWRMLAWAIGVFLLRHMFVRRPAIHQRLAAVLRESVRPRSGVSPGGDGLETAGTRVPSWPVAVLPQALAVILLFWGLTFLMTYPQFRVLDRGVALEIGDPLLSTWRLSWFAHQVVHDPRHLFDANIFYPEKTTLAFSDAMLVPSLMSAPLMWLSVPPLVVYNLLLLSGFALSGAAMFLLVRSLTHHTGAAVAGGFVFAFLPYRFMHYGHVELQMAQWMPLCLWSLHRTVRDGRMRDGLLTGAFLALQTLSSFYYGIFFATYLIPVGIALLIGERRACVMPTVRALATGAALAALVVVPFARPYFAARQTVGERALAEVQSYSALPRDYLVAHPRNTLFGPLSAGKGSLERQLFAGVVVPAVALAALWPPLSAARIGYAVGLAVAVELSLGTNGKAYPWLRTHVLPFRGLRVPARMAILVGLSLAILVGYAVARIARAVRSRSVRLMLGAGFAIAVAAEYHSTLAMDEIWREPPSVYAALAGQPGAVLLELPLESPAIARASVYMYFSVFHWHPLVNGYSGFVPRWYDELLSRMTTFPDDATIEDLQRRGVDYVIVHGAFYPPEDFRELVGRLDERQDLHLEAVTSWERRETRLYKVLR